MLCNPTMHPEVSKPKDFSYFENLVIGTISSGVQNNLQVVFLTFFQQAIS